MWSMPLELKFNPSGLNVLVGVVVRTTFSGNMRKRNNRKLYTSVVFPIHSRSPPVSVSLPDAGRNQSDSELWLDLRTDMSSKEVPLKIGAPFSSSFLSSSHFHLFTSSEVTTLRTSSSEAFVPCLTHPGSGQQTRSTSPSEMHRPQKSTRQALQNTWSQANEMHLVPLIELKHTPQA